MFSKIQSVLPMAQARGSISAVRASIQFHLHLEQLKICLALLSCKYKFILV